MSNAPSHYKEHEELMQLIGKIVEDSKLIDGVVLVTIGVDGRPCVGSNASDVATITALFRQLGEAEDAVLHQTKVPIPRNN